LSMHMPSRYWKSAILVALMVVVPAAATGSARPARGTLVVHVRFGGGLTPDGTVASSPGAGAHITVTGQDETLHLRADHRGIAKATLRPGRYKVSIPSSASHSSELQTAVVRARKTTTARLATVCNTC